MDIIDLTKHDITIKLEPESFKLILEGADLAGVPVRFYLTCEQLAGTKKHIPLSRFVVSAALGGYFFVPHLNSTTK